MSELRQLTNCIYCCKLEEPIPDFSGQFSCFFLVNHVDNYDYAEGLCKRLILAGCRYFHSYGRYSLIWDNAADFADINLGGLEDEDLFAMTSEEDDEDAFREEIYHHYLEYNNENHKYLLRLIFSSTSMLPSQRGTRQAPECLDSVHISAHSRELL